MQSCTAAYLLSPPSRSCRCLKNGSAQFNPALTARAGHARRGARRSTAAPPRVAAHRPAQGHYHRPASQAVSCRLAPVSAAPVEPPACAARCAASAAVVGCSAAAASAKSGLSGGRQFWALLWSASGRAVHHMVCPNAPPTHPANDRRTNDPPRLLERSAVALQSPRRCSILFISRRPPSRSERQDQRRACAIYQTPPPPQPPKPLNPALAAACPHAEVTGPRTLHLQAGAAPPLAAAAAAPGGGCGRRAAAAAGPSRASRDARAASSSRLLPCTCAAGHQI